MSKPIDKQYLVDNMKTFVSVILDPRYIIQKQVLPQATATLEGVVYQYIGSDNVNYTIGGFYACREVTPATDPKTYFWEEITTRTLIDNTTIKENSSKQIYVPKATDAALGVVQAGDGIGVDSDGVISVVARLEEIDELPTAAAALEGKIYLLTATQTGYDRGGIYMCEESTETAGTYEWKLISMSPLEAGKGITIEDDVISADTNIFFGTMDEWDALTEAEQAEYDCIATPDEAVEDIADAIIDGDMRAVTSNAVAQVVPSDASASNKLVTVDDVTATATTVISGATVTQSTGTINNIWMCRAGSVVQLRISLKDCTLTTASATTLQITLPSSVPKPVMETWGSNDHYTTVSPIVDEAAACRFLTDGTIYVFTSADNSPLSGAIVNIGITYLTRE